jgi:UDP:flavonoid glycosyltransferase YjiC (YdhE family)
MTTSGFESVCEAMWFGKPVFSVPVENHYEQLCNGHDMQASGAGIWSAKLEPDKFLEYLPRHTTDPEPTRQWFRQAGPVLVEELESAPKKP